MKFNFEVGQICTHSFKKPEQHTHTHTNTHTYIHTILFWAQERAHTHFEWTGFLSFFSL